MTTAAQVADLDDADLIERIEETFDHPLVRELSQRFADLIDDDRYENYGHRELIAAGEDEVVGSLTRALASRLKDALELLTGLTDALQEGSNTLIALSGEAADWLKEGGVEV
jgi:hypothetical protein